MFSIYAHSRDTRGVRQMNLTDIVNGIISGAHDLDVKTRDCNKLKAGDPKVYRDYKANNLPAFTPTGTFKEKQRNSKGLLRHSGYCIIDLDEFPNVQQVADLKVELVNWDTVKLVFVSPSALGLKILMPISPIPKTPEEHEAAWHACAERFDELQGGEFQFSIDSTGKDLPRLCYLCHDPTAVLREKSTPTTWEMPKPKPVERPTENPNPSHTDFDVSILDFIPCGTPMPDLKRGEGVVDPYDVWLQVGMALKEVGAEVSVWDAWSAKDPREGQYQAGGCQAKWDTFKRSDDAVKVGWTRLVEWAKLGGYEPPPKKTRDFVGNFEPLTDEQVDTDISDIELPVFPDELFTGIFASYQNALHEANPVPDSFLFATLKQAICATLGRAVFIDTEPRVYPILYTGLIGDSSDGHKGIAIKFMKHLLAQSDENVLQMPSITTEEGLIDMFVEPKAVKGEDDTIETYRDGWFPFVNNKERAEEIMGQQLSNESIRILGTFEEFSQVLHRGKKNYGAGLLELMMELYDAPDVIVSPNKSSKSKADYPTWGVVGASAFNLMENALDTNYIGGGLTNRFEWYHGEKKRSMFSFGKPNADAWSATVEVLNALRHRFDSPTSYQITPEGNALGQAWLEQFEDGMKQVDHEFVVSTLKRQKILIMKNALLFSVLRNEDTDINADDIGRAVTLSEYTCNVVDLLFKNFHNTETKRVVDRIIAVLKKKPRMSKKAIWHQMRWAELRTVEEEIDRLARMGVLGVEKPKRTQLYAVLKDVAN